MTANNTRRTVSDRNEEWIIYVLECERGRYYIGRTRNLDRRFAEHLSGDGSQWTSTYAPISVTEKIHSSDPFDEDKMVKKYMAQFGVDQVRGGSYSQIELPQDQRAVLEREIAGATDRCLNCGKDGHFARTCPSYGNKTLSVSQGASEACFRCGRSGHFVSDCFAQTHISGALLVSSDGDDAIEDACFRCGRYGHFASDCFAKTHVNGSALIQASDSNNRSHSRTSNSTEDANPHEDKTCHRCGRNGHFSNSCYAKTHIKGSVLASAYSQPSAGIKNSAQAVHSSRPSSKSTSSSNVDSCHRCGRSGHYSNTCYAKTHAKGTALQPVRSTSNHGSRTSSRSRTNTASSSQGDRFSSSQSQSNQQQSCSGTCHRCGRSGHYSNDCYATQHSNGTYLAAKRRRGNGYDSSSSDEFW